MLDRALSLADLGLDSPATPYPNNRDPGLVPIATLPHFYWYDKIIDFYLLHPGVPTVTEIGKHIGRSPNWVSLLMRSDSFRARMTERKDQNAQALDAAFKNQAGTVVLKGLGVLADKLDNSEKLPIGAVLEVVDRVAEKLGFVVPVAPTGISVSAPGGQVAILSATPQDLQRAQEKIRRLEADRLGGSTGPTPSPVVPPLDNVLPGPVEPLPPEGRRAPAQSQLPLPLFQSGPLIDVIPSEPAATD